MKLNIGVTNPYAIAELVAGKRIRWNSFTDPMAELSSILQLSPKSIFATDSPLLRPNVTTDTESGELKVLSISEARDRMKSYLKANLPQTPSISSRGLKVLNHERAKLVIDTLMSAQLDNNNQPWQPAGIEWVDKGDFFEDVDEINDPIQGALGDCYLIAAMSSVAWSRSYAIANVVRPSAWGEDNSPIHRTIFYKDGNAAIAEAIEVSELVPVEQSSHNWIFARSRDNGETWPAIVEKAYAKWATSNSTDFPDYNPLNGGDPVFACAQLISGTPQYRWNNDISEDELIQLICANITGKRTINPMVAWTHATAPEGLDYDAAHVVGWHAYSILGLEWMNCAYYVVLRNPWGTHEAILDVLPGSWYSTGPHETLMPLNTDGVFAMKASTFKQYFAGIGWVI